jgi:hypothetical protein
MTRRRSRGDIFKAAFVSLKLMRRLFFICNHRAKLEWGFQFYGFEADVL